ncbi:MAG: hypothetical protein AB1631_31485 [Acidobacteriota bacterium]
MKKLIPSPVVISSSLLIVLTVAGVRANAQARMTDRVFEGLKGRVKAVKEDRAKLVNKAGKLVEKDRSLCRSSSYDTSGNLTMEYVTATSGSNSRTYYRYEKNGDRKEETKLDDSPLGIPGQPALNLNITITGTTRFKYDEEGRRIEEITSKADGAISWRGVYSYDSSGRRTGKDSYIKNQLMLKTALSYDEQGNISELTEYKPDGSVTRKESYSYEFDSAGNWIKRVTSVWVTKEGKSSFEPSEVTYRKIAYY